MPIPLIPRENTATAYSGEFREAQTNFLTDILNLQKYYDQLAGENDAQAIAKTSILRARIMTELSLQLEKFNTHAAPYDNVDEAQNLLKLAMYYQELIMKIPKAEMQKLRELRHKALKVTGFVANNTVKVGAIVGGSILGGPFGIAVAVAGYGHALYDFMSNGNRFNQLQPETQVLLDNLNASSAKAISLARDESRRFEEAAKIYAAKQTALAKLHSPTARETSSSSPEPQARPMSAPPAMALPNDPFAEIIIQQVAAEQETATPMRPSRR